MHPCISTYIHEREREVKNDRYQEREGNIYKYSTDTKEVVREYYEPLNANKFNNFNEMYNFTERHKIPKVIHEEIDYFYGLTCIKVMEFIAKHFPQRKLHTQMALLANSTKHFRKK